MLPNFDQPFPFFYSPQSSTRFFAYIYAYFSQIFLLWMHYSFICVASLETPYPFVHKCLRLNWQACQSIRPLNALFSNEFISKLMVY